MPIVTPRLLLYVLYALYGHSSPQPFSLHHDLEPLQRIADRGVEHLARRELQEEMPQRPDGKARNSNASALLLRRHALDKAFLDVLHDDRARRDEHARILRADLDMRDDRALDSQESARM
jgi:hypothetical protein